MSRVLLLCPEPLGHGHPAGVGIRFLEMARALRAEGHAVTLLTPDGAAIAGCACAELRPELVRDRSLECDVVVVQGQSGNEFFSHGAARPVVVDLYDPYAVEHLHYHDAEGEHVFVHNHRSLMRSLHRGDFFLCASEAQRLFYLGLLLATGRLNPLSYRDDPTASRLLAIAPFGVPAPRAVPPKPLGAPSLLFGGIYDWYDTVLAIDAVARARRSLPGLTLTFSRHPNAELTPQGAAEATEHYVRDKGYGEFVRFAPWTPYDERAAFYDRFVGALLTFPASVETDLAMRTRVLDYLWAGLPVISSPGRGTDELIERFGAGTIVRESGADAVAAAIVALLSNPHRYLATAAGAAAFATEHQWSRTLRPLLDFCQTPRFDVTRDAFTSLESDVARLERDKQELIAALGEARRQLEQSATAREAGVAAMTASGARIDELTGQVRTLAAERDDLRRRLEATERESHAINGERQSLRELTTRQQAAIDEQTAASAKLFAEIERLNGLLNQVYGSRAWKLQQAWSRLKGKS